MICFSFCKITFMAGRLSFAAGHELLGVFMTDFLIQLLELSWWPLSLDSPLMIIPFGLFCLSCVFALIRRFIGFGRF